MKNKYEFFKRMYKEFVIVFDYQGNRVSFGYDSKLMKYIKKGDINYIVVYNDFTVEKVVRKVNNYKKYLIKLFLEEICVR